MTQYQVKPIDVLMLSILVLYLGMYLTRKIRVLRDNYIPPAVTGGLLCSIVVALIYGLADIEITFDMQIRDVLLLVFFSTVGRGGIVESGGNGVPTLPATYHFIRLGRGQWTIRWPQGRAGSSPAFGTNDFS